MFGFSTPAVLIIGIIAVSIFGVGRLPELGSSLGKAITNFRKSCDGKDQVEINPKQES